MKNTIMYNYNLKNIYNYRTVKNKIQFNSEGISYTFEQCTDKEHILYIYQNFNSKYICDEIIPNINKSLFTYINGINYILIKHMNGNNDIYNLIIGNKNYVKRDSFLERTNWTILWSKKLDYYEYQQHHINKYSYIIESFNYYLGMGETAISYIEYNFMNKNIPKVISHKRISNIDFNNPINLIIDYRARDVSEYLKYIFLINKYKNFSFEQFFNKLKFNRDDYILLYGRLLFPNFYFDIYDDIINNNLKQKEILNIISRSNEYEEYVSMLYKKINSITKIPQINWL